MTEKERNITRLKHIRDAIDAIDSFGISSIRDLNDQRNMFAVAKGLEIIGEAAKNLNAQLRDEYDHIPWSEIIAMRNLLSHEYFRWDVGTIWSTVQIELPVLKEHIG